MAKDPATVAANWASRLGQSTQAITDGINSVQTAPGVAAARQKSVWVNNTQAAANKWATNTANVTLPEWQQAMIQKGVPRIASGAQAAQPKMAQFMTKLLPYIDQAKAGLPARGDLNANINRMVSFTQKMAQFSK
jgi:hypothetical protein